MKKYVSFWTVLIAALAVQVPCLVHAKRLSRHRGGITAALQQSPGDEEKSLFMKEQPIQLASVDKLSLSFEERHKEISRDQLQEKGVDQTPFGGSEPTSNAQEVQNLIRQSPDLSMEELAQRQTLPAQARHWDRPKELQETAKAHLEKAEKKEVEKEEENIELQFEEADLLTFVKQISDIFKVTFISDDAIDPLPQKGDTPARALKGNKISFKTTTPISKQDAWNLFITFLNISGFAIVQQADPTIYRIETIKAAQRAPIPTFIGINYQLLPANDELIRYLYFVENATLDAIKPIVEQLKSSNSPQPIYLTDQKAFILTDKSYNIRSLMAIIKELDKVTMPQAMSVLKLREADAMEVKKLYEELSQSGEDRSSFRPFGARKQPTAIFFPENVKIVAEPRTNSLVLLGQKDAIDKIEEFIIKHVDVALDQPYSPLYTYQLQYANATTVAKIMNDTTKLGQNTEVGKAGGVRGKDKYLRAMSFTPEPSTNKLIIKGDYDDYLMAKSVIEELDKPQAQVALDVLILDVELRDAKEIGVQLRSKVPGLDGILGQNVEFATSGLRAGGAPSGILTNPNGSGANRLLGNLVNLVSQAPAGNTILTFGQDLFGVWGLFQALRTITNVQVVSNPFLFASNNTKSTVSLGETRRVVTSTVFAGENRENAEGDDKAALTVGITPQINSDGMIVLKVRVDITQFTDSDPSSATKTTKLVDTEAVVADREVLALGGLLRNQTINNLSKTPILGDIPVLGWLFKNKRKALDKSSLLILISSKIIPPHATSDVNQYTKERLNTYRTTMGDLAQADGKLDPIHKLFFADESAQQKQIGEFIFDRHQRQKRKLANKRKERAKKQQYENNYHNNKESGTHETENVQLAQSSRRGRRRGRSRKPAIAPVVQEPVTIAHAAKVKTIATPTELEAAPKLGARKRRGKSLSSFIDMHEQQGVA